MNRLTGASLLAVGILAMGGVASSVKEPRANAQAPVPTGVAIQSRAVATDASGVAMWTYPEAYAVGVVPIVTCLAVASPASVGPLSCLLDGAPTSTTAILRVQGALGITTIHVTAQAPKP